MDNTQKTTVLKPTGTVQIANKFSLVERKLLNVIIWHSQKRGFESQEYSLPIAQVFQIIGLENSHNYDVLKDALRTLTGTVIEWNIFGDDRTQEWGVCTFLASGKINNGRVKYRLNPEIVEKIKHPVLFARIQLMIQSLFKKRNTLVLYEFFMDFLSRQKVDKLVIEDVSLDRIHSLLGMDNTRSVEEGNFKFFNRDALKPSVDEINQSSDIQVSYQPVRKQRKVVALVFQVERKPSFQLFMALPGGGAAKVYDPDYQILVNELVEKLTERGIGLRKARQLVNTYTSEQIAANLELVDEELHRGRAINNVSAYLVKAIEENYRPKPSTEQPSPAEKSGRRRQVEAVELPQEALLKEWGRFCSRRLKENFAAMPADWQEEKRRQFHTVLQDEAQSGNSLVYQRYHRDGFNSALVESCFFNGLKTELLTRPEELSLEAYLAWREATLLIEATA